MFTAQHKRSLIVASSQLGANYMSRAGSVSRVGSVYRDDCSARYYMRRASPPAAKFQSCRVKRGYTKEHEPSISIFANSLFWCIIFSFTYLYGLINLCVLYRKRNIDLVVSHFALKRNLVTRKCCPG